MKRILLAIALLVFSSVSCSGGEGEMFKSQTWPNADSSCDDCIPIQFDRLSLQLPRSKLRKVHVLHMNMPAISLSYQLNSTNGQGNISLLLMDERKATGGLREEGIFERLSVGDLHQFFASLGRPNADKQALELSRKIMGISEATEYLTISGESASAFWIKGREFDNQSLYVVEKDSSFAY